MIALYITTRPRKVLPEVEFQEKVEDELKKLSDITDKTRLTGTYGNRKEGQHPLYGSATYKKHEYLLKILCLFVGLILIGFGAWFVYDTVQGNSFDVELKFLDKQESGKIFFGLFCAFCGCVSLYVLLKWEQMKKTSERRWLSGEEDYGDDD
jgi:hypothetical protein